MSRLIIVSNRLPVSLKLADDGSFSLTQNVGGLATAIGPYHKAHNDCLWVGWSGIPEESHSAEQIGQITKDFESRRCIPIFLTQSEIDGYYAGFSNDTLWPLFHDFAHEAKFDPATWQTYRQVNERFCKVVAPLVQPGDSVWIQDYHLMLLPQMLRERFPDLHIGWFLHIPFPSPEIFHQLPWGADLIKGLLGADLLGFHTVDFCANFMASVKLLLGLEVDGDGRIAFTDGRRVTVDAFPIGIDYGLYRRTSHSKLAQDMRHGIEAMGGRRTRRLMTSLSAEGRAALEAENQEGTWWSNGSHDELSELSLTRPATAAEPKTNKIVVSVDRLDYTKGLPERLRAFDLMLKKYPEWVGHVTYYMLATPSREGVESYQRLKREVDQLVGEINGKFSLLSWTPIHYITRSLPIKPVCGIYAAGDVAFVTPLRDGMNLVAKEYLACHDGRDGALVLSDMCGAARELTDAFIVNPYDTDALCEALHSALEIDAAESRRRNRRMQARLEYATAGLWCDQFLAALRQASTPGLADHRLRSSQRDELVSQWGEAKRKLLLCDYDGTLTPLVRTPDRARPRKRLLNLLRRLGSMPGVDLAIVSGRDRETMEQWFGALPVRLVAEHGVWMSESPMLSKDNADSDAGAGNESGLAKDSAVAGFVQAATAGESGGIERIGKTDNSVQISQTVSRVWHQCAGLPDPAVWHPRIEPLLKEAVARVPKSFIETKSNTLAWHYRMSDQRQAAEECDRLLSHLREVCPPLGLMVMENSKVIEVCPVSISKGQAVAPLVRSGDYDFVMAVGDDTTDETMFAAVPETLPKSGGAGYTVKVGVGPTKAHSRIADSGETTRLLGYLAAESKARLQ